MRARSAFALRYNDKSVLEAHHVAAAFSLMLREGHDILGRLDLQQSLALLFFAVHELFFFCCAFVRL